MKSTYRIPLNKISAQDLAYLSSAPHVRLQLSDGAKKNIARGERALATLLREGKVVYGVNTGVGDLCDTVLPDKEICTLQENIILSHACGGAPYLEPNVARGALFLTANALAKGFSGVRRDTIQKLITIFNAGVSPLLPKQGSLGASGDLIPLAHLGLLLLGKGSALINGKQLPAARILRGLGIKPVVLHPKEALGLINGTEAVTSLGAFVVQGAENFIRLEIQGLVPFFEVLGASRISLDPRIHALKPHSGQQEIASILRSALRASTLCDRPNKKVQDPYVVRCAPQIDGAIFDAIMHAQQVLETEINSVTDNPLFFSEGRHATWASGGNFHAQSIAFAMDSLGIALTACSKLLERRIERLLNARLSGLPPFLAKEEGGLHSGLMIPQYLAAALVAENSVLAHPASIQSISVSADQEDFVSMAMTSANKAEQILSNCQKVLAIFLFSVAQAMDMFVQQEGKSMHNFSPVSRTLHAKVRNVSPYVQSDRMLGNDIEKITHLVRGGF